MSERGRSTLRFDVPETAEAEVARAMMLVKAENFMVELLGMSGG